MTPRTGQAIRQNAACRAAADDDVVEPFVHNAPIWRAISLI